MVNENTLVTYPTAYTSVSGYGTGNPTYALGPPDGLQMANTSRQSGNKSITLTGFDFSALNGAEILSLGVSAAANANDSTYTHAFHMRVNNVTREVIYTNLGYLTHSTVFYSTGEWTQADLDQLSVLLLVSSSRSFDTTRAYLESLAVHVTYSAGPSIPAKRWNGTSWVDASTAKRWTGSEWVDATVTRY